jgi:hypothetical protein
MIGMFRRCAGLQATCHQAEPVSADRLFDFVWKFA